MSNFKLKYNLEELNCIAQLVQLHNPSMCNGWGLHTVEKIENKILDDATRWAKEVVDAKRDFGIWSSGGYQVSFMVNYETKIVGATISLSSIVLDAEKRGQEEVEL